MTALVCLDTETGIITRWDGRRCTHAAGLTHDPNDAIKTAHKINGFRLNPHYDFAVPGPRTYEDALRDQRARLNK